MSNDKKLYGCGDHNFEELETTVFLTDFLYWKCKNCEHTFMCHKENKLSEEIISAERDKWENK